MSKKSNLTISPLLGESKALIEQGRQQLAVAVNSAMSLLYWRIGTRIHKEVLINRRAEYEKEVVATLSAQLTGEYGSGWGEKQLRHCLRATEAFPNQEIFYTLCRELSRSQIRCLQDYFFNVNISVCPKHK